MLRLVVTDCFRVGLEHSKSKITNWTPLTQRLWGYQNIYHETSLQHDLNGLIYGYTNTANSIAMTPNNVVSWLDIFENSIWFSRRKGTRPWSKYLRKQGFLARVRTIAGRKILRRQIQKGKRVIGRPKN